MIIYNATYCDCIHESAYATISLHKTRQGAEEAIEKHKLAEEAQYYEMMLEIRKHKIQTTVREISPYMASKFEAYAIIEDELLD